jgi:soluble lytic murein transglycosylase-like protein
MILFSKETISTNQSISYNLLYEDELLVAIAKVESKLDSTAYLKSENAVGILQIRPIMVKDVNRILKLKNINITYTLNDRWNINKSVEMFNIYTNYYTKMVGNKERIARRWNGGPNGHKKKSTISYWNKVKKVLESDWIKEINLKSINI